MEPTKEEMLDALAVMNGEKPKANAAIRQGEILVSTNSFAPVYKQYGAKSYCKIYSVHFAFEQKKADTAMKKVYT